MKLLLIAAVALYYVVCQADGAGYNEPSVLRGGRPSALLNKKKEQALQKKTGLHSSSDRKTSYEDISNTIMTKIKQCIEGIILTLARIKDTVDAFGWASISKLIKSFITGFNEFMDDLRSDDLRSGKTFRGSLGSTTMASY